MTRTHLFGILSLAALAACGGAETTSSTTQPVAGAGQAKRVSYEGYTLQYEEAGDKLTNLKAFTPGGDPLEVVQFSAKDLVVCVPRVGAPAGVANVAQMNCQPMASALNGSIIRMGTATCRCQFFNGILYCYGDTCQ